jgi:hypothetical protein
MKAILCLACFLLIGPGARAEGSSSSPGGGKEPTGGLVEIALTPTELGSRAVRRIRLLLDPQVLPPVYYPSKEYLPARPLGEARDPDPVLPFSRELNRVGGEAAIYLAYGTSLYVKILRFATAKEAEDHWLSRRQAVGPKTERVAGEEVLSTEHGQVLRPGVKARMNTVECRSGRYLIRVAPAKPVLDDPGLSFALKQVEKIRKRHEAIDAANRSERITPETKQAPSAVGSGR